MVRREPFGAHSSAALGDYHAAVNNRQQSAEFALDALADNGGDVPTRLPGSGSVLVDAIPSTACVIPADARDVLRPRGEGCDIGAVEAR